MESVSTARLVNGEWLTGLKEGRNDTLTALRVRIRQGLGAALGGRADVDDADLDDFTQDAMLQVLKGLDSFRSDSAFTTWAMAVAVRVSLTALRRRRWSGHLLDERLAALASPGITAGSAAARTTRGELMDVLRNAIATELTSHQRQVLLGELEGIPQVVLAERLSATPGAIYKASHDARRKLKAALVRSGYDAKAVAEVLAGEG